MTIKVVDEDGNPVAGELVSSEIEGEIIEYSSGDDGTVNINYESTDEGPVEYVIAVGDETRTVQATQAAQTETSIVSSNNGGGRRRSMKLSRCVQILKGKIRRGKASTAMDHPKEGGYDGRENQDELTLVTVCHEQGSITITPIITSMLRRAHAVKRTRNVHPAQNMRQRSSKLPKATSSSVIS